MDVKPKRKQSNGAGVTFSSLDKHLAIRTDGNKNECRFNGLKVDSTETALRLCIARQEANQKHRHTSNKLKSFECENCKCGIEILTGKRKEMPSNWELIK